MLGLKKTSIKVIFFLLILSQSALAASPLQGSWRGIIANSKSSQDVILSFNEQGYLLYSYLNKNNEEIKIPLDYQGQIVEYLPSGGGVASVSVRYLEKIENRLSLTLDESFQKVANGNLSQSSTTTVFQVALDEESLKIRQIIAAEGGVADVSSMADSSLSTVISDDMTYVGTLKKVE